MITPPSVGGIGCTIALVLEPSFAEVRRYRFIGIVWNVSAALADVIIAAMLVQHLVRLDFRWRCLGRPETVYADHSECSRWAVETQDRGARDGQHDQQDNPP